MLIPRVRFTRTDPVVNLVQAAICGPVNPSTSRRINVSWYVSGKERKKILHNVADAIVDNAREIALVESYDSGQPLKFMNKAAIRGAANFRFFADLAPNARDGQALPADDHINYSIRQPIGPVGVITPRFVKPGPVGFMPP